MAKLPTTECYRVSKAKLWFNPDDWRSRAVAQALAGKMSAVTQAAARLLEFLKRPEHLSVMKDADDKLERVDLRLPAEDEAILSRAKTLLNTERPQYQQALARREEKRRTKAPGPKALAQPTYFNAYHLVGVENGDGRGKMIVFRLAECFSFRPDRGPRRGQTVRELVTIDATIGLQRLITGFTPGELWQEIPRLLRDGVAQELAQQLLSFIGLTAADSQPGTAMPSLGGERLLPWRLVNRKDAPVYLRRWNDDAGRPRAALYLALPTALLGLSEEEAEQNGLLRWHRERQDEFKALPPWLDCPLSRRRPLFLAPLSFRGSRRRLRRWSHNVESAEHRAFVRSLADARRTVCWSQLIGRDENGEKAFFFHVTTSHRVTVPERPNLIGVSIGREDIREENGKAVQRICLWWALDAMPEGETEKRGVIAVDELPLEGKWPRREERRRRAREAARTLARLAHRFDAHLAVEEVVKVRKRTADGLANRLATRFNFSDLARLIEQKGLDHDPPVAVAAKVSGFSLPEESAGVVRAEAVLREGLKVKTRRDQARLSEAPSS